MIICKYLTRMPAYRITTSLVIAFMFFPPLFCASQFEFIFSFSTGIIGSNETGLYGRQFHLEERSFFFFQNVRAAQLVWLGLRTSERAWKCVKTRGVCNDILMGNIAKVEIRLHSDIHAVTLIKCHRWWRPSACRPMQNRDMAHTEHLWIVGNL